METDTWTNFEKLNIGGVNWPSVTPALETQFMMSVLLMPYAFSIPCQAQNKLKHECFNGAFKDALI